MADYLSIINQRLLEYTASIEEATLKEAIHYALFPGGKRMRPVMLLSVLSDLGLDISQGTDAACALEMIHTYSLIHDDLPAMDNDDYRRGRLTVHKMFGEALAILAGDALLTDAFLVLSSSPLSDDRKTALTALFSRHAGGQGMVRGQVLDIASCHQTLTEAEVRKIAHHKTGDLIHCALDGAAIIAGFQKSDRDTMSTLADCFGLAFQVKDDIEDWKAETSDTVLEKATFPSVLGIDAAKTLLLALKEQALVLCQFITGQKDLYQLIERIL